MPSLIPFNIDSFQGTVPLSWRALKYARAHPTYYLESALWISISPQSTDDYTQLSFVSICQRTVYCKWLFVNTELKRKQEKGEVSSDAHFTEGSDCNNTNYYALNTAVWHYSSVGLASHEVTNPYIRPACTDRCALVSSFRFAIKPLSSRRPPSRAPISKAEPEEQVRLLAAVEFLHHLRNTRSNTTASDCLNTSHHMRPAMSAAHCETLRTYITIIPRRTSLPKSLWPF